MNKRIQELFDRTLEQFNEEHKDAPYRAMFIVPDPVKEKFAELIVQECMSLCQECIDDGCIEAEEPMRKIKQHFGVES